MFEKSEGWVVTEKGYIHYKSLEKTRWLHGCGVYSQLNYLTDFVVLRFRVHLNLNPYIPPTVTLRETSINASVCWN